MGHSKSSLFLMELILSILFFSLASTVCIQLFVRSHTISEYTVDLNNATIQAQNLAEAYSFSDGQLVSIQSIYRDSVYNDSDCLTIYYDKEWNIIPPSSFDLYSFSGLTPTYMARIISTETENSHLCCAHIFIETYDKSGYQNQAPIYELEIEHHIPYTKEDI